MREGLSPDLNYLFTPSTFTDTANKDNFTTGILIQRPYSTRFTSINTFLTPSFMRGRCPRIATSVPTLHRRRHRPIRYGIYPDRIYSVLGPQLPVAPLDLIAFSETHTVLMQTAKSQASSADTKLGRRPPGPSFDFHQFTNPLKINTEHGIEVPKRIGLPTFRQILDLRQEFANVKILLRLGGSSKRILIHK